MSISTSTTSVSAAPASVLDPAQLVRNAGAEAETDPALFLAALVRQWEAAKGGTAPDFAEDGPAIVSVEKSDPSEDVLQELLQYVSNLDALSVQPLNDGTEAPGGNAVPVGGNWLPETASLDAYSESATLSADQLPAELAALVAPSAFSDRSAAPDGLGGKVTDSDHVLTLADGEKLTSGRDAGVLYPSRREGSGSTDAEMSSFGTASSDAKEPDALSSQVLAAGPEGVDSDRRATDERLFSQFDKKLPELTKVAAEGLRSAWEGGIPAQSIPLSTQPSAVSVGDSVPALDKPLNQAGWQEALGERILWMTDKNLKTAEIKLNPAHLGSLEIRIQMDQDQASVHFVTHDTSVREAIEAAAPKLREMLGAQEINLADLNVTVSSGLSDERGASADFGRQPGFGDRNRPFSNSASAKNEDVPADSGQAVTRSGLLNLYV